MIGGVVTSLLVLALTLTLVLVYNKAYKLDETIEKIN